MEALQDLRASRSRALHYLQHSKKFLYVLLENWTGGVRAHLVGMTQITSFRDLLVWQKAMDLAVRTYRLTQRLPNREQWTLGHQLQKSSLSIPSNIAEGWARHSTPTYVHHLRTSQGSGAELETQVEVGRRVDLIEVRAADMLIRDSQEIGRMLNGLIASFERTSSKDA